MSLWRLEWFISSEPLILPLFHTLLEIAWQENRRIGRKDRKNHRLELTAVPVRRDMGEPWHPQEQWGEDAGRISGGSAWRA